MIAKLAKVGAGVFVFGGTIAGTVIGVRSSLSQSDEVQRILEWEKLNGGCRIHMVVSTHPAILYRVGESDRKGITDENLQDLYKDLAWASIRDVDARKRECKRAAGKDLVLANRGGWAQDNPKLNNLWKTKVKDLAE